jgi:hypothetical protein
MQPADERRRGDAGKHAEYDIQHQGKRSATKIIRKRHDVGHEKRWIGAEEKTAEESCDAGRGCHWEKGVDADFRQHQLSHEQDAADRRVECGGNAGARARRNKSDALAGRQLDDLAERRAECGTDLNDRPFAADSGTGADSDGRGNGFHGGDDRPDDAPFIINGVHDFRDTMSLCLRRKVRDDERHDDGADDRHKDHRRAPWMGGRELARVVVYGYDAQEKQVVHEADHGSE